MCSKKTLKNRRGRYLTPSHLQRHTILTSRHSKAQEAATSQTSTDHRNRIERKEDNRSNGFGEHKATWGQMIGTMREEA